ncbi:MAG: hypothetical protein AAGL98_01255, partial [Planctomycetota bacterium]
LRARFVHGGSEHEYTITKNFDQIRLYVDGREYELLEGTYPVSADLRESRSNRAFFRFGAESDNEQVKVLYHTVRITTAIEDLFARGPLVRDLVAPAAVTGFGLDNSPQVPGVASLVWNRSIEEDVAAYRVTIKQFPGWEAFVANHGEPRIDLPLIPLAYDAWVQAIDTAGNLGPIGGSPLAFNVDAIEEDFIENLSRTAGVPNGYTVVPADLTEDEASGWIVLPQGERYTRPLDQAVDNWSIELDYALRPTIVNDAGITRRRQDRVRVLELIHDQDGTNSRRRAVPVEIDLERIRVGFRTLPESFVSGGDQHTLRLINISQGPVAGLHVLADVTQIGNQKQYVLLGTIDPVRLREFSVGSLNSTASSGSNDVIEAAHLGLQRLSFFHGGTGPTILQALVPLPPSELVIDESASDSESISRPTLVWQSAADDVALITAEYLKASSRSTTWTSPARYLDTEDFTFTAITRHARPLDGDPFQVLLKATPTDVRAQDGVGSARAILQPYNRADGSGVYWAEAVPNSDQLEDSGWTYRSNNPETPGYPRVLAPSVVVPRYAVSVGKNPELVVEELSNNRFNDVIKPEGFEATLLPGASADAQVQTWEFTGFARFDAAAGTLLQAYADSDPDRAPLFELRYSGATLYINDNSEDPEDGHPDFQITVNRSSDIQKFRVVAERAFGGSWTGINFYLGNNTRPLRFQETDPYTLLLNKVFESDGVIRFGSLSDQAYSQSSSGAVPRNGTTWSGVQLSVNGTALPMVDEAGPLPPRWRHYEPAGLTSEGAAPQADDASGFGFMVLEAINRLGGVTEDEAGWVELDYDLPNASLDDQWSLEFNARLDQGGAGTGSAHVVASGGNKRVTVRVSGAAIYRVTHTPHGTVLFQNGRRTADVIGEGSVGGLTVETIDRPDPFDLQLRVINSDLRDYRESTGLSLRYPDSRTRLAIDLDWMLLNGAIDDSTIGFNPIRNFHFTEVHKTKDGEAFDDPETSRIVFANAMLSRGQGSLSWSFNTLVDPEAPGGLVASDLVSFPIDAPFIAADYVPGRYGVNAIEDPAEVPWTVAFQNVSPRAEFLESDEVAAPVNLEVTPATDEITLTWSAGSNNTSNYVVWLIDEQLGLLPLPNDSDPANYVVATDEALLGTVTIE